MWLNLMSIFLLQIHCPPPIYYTRNTAVLVGKVDFTVRRLNKTACLIVGK